MQLGHHHHHNNAANTMNNAIMMQQMQQMQALQLMNMNGGNNGNGNNPLQMQEAMKVIQDQNAMVRQNVMTQVLKYGTPMPTAQIVELYPQLYASLSSKFQIANIVFGIVAIIILAVHVMNKQLPLSQLTTDDYPFYAPTQSDYDQISKSYYIIIAGYALMFLSQSISALAQRYSKDPKPSMHIWFIVFTLADLIVIIIGFAQLNSSKAISFSFSRSSGLNASFAFTIFIHLVTCILNRLLYNFLSRLQLAKEELSNSPQQNQNSQSPFQNYNQVQQDQSQYN